MSHSNNKEFNSIFSQNYNGSNIEEVIDMLKTVGASQMETLKVLMDELHLSIPDADNIVLNATSWGENKERNLALRNAFFDFLGNYSDDDDLTREG